MKAPLPLLSVAAAACLWAGPAPGAEPAPRAATAPAATVLDLCAGSIDPYDEGEQRGLFHQAAGADGSLDVKEFFAARKARGRFVQSFDNWPAVMSFDRDGSRSIDWSEADAYRKDLRRRLLGAFDANADGRLTGPERDRANRALAAGDLPGWWPCPLIPAPPISCPDAEAIRRHDANGDGRLDDGEVRAWYRRRAEAQQKQWLARYDADGNGTFDERERRSWSAESRRLAEARQAEILARYDADGDGKLSAAERSTEQEDWRRAWLRWKYDRNGDGELDEAERAAIRKDEALRQVHIQEAKQRAEAHQKQLLARYDADGDGKLSDEERKAWYAERYRQYLLRRFDKDKDGKLGAKEEAEKAKYLAEAEQRRRDYHEQYVKPWDTDGDGKLSAEEMRTRTEHYRKKAEQRSREILEQWDADGDGKLSAGERGAMAEAYRKQAANTAGAGASRPAAAPPGR